MVAESPDRERVFAGSPGLARLPSGGAGRQLRVVPCQAAHGDGSQPDRGTGSAATPAPPGSCAAAPTSSGRAPSPMYGALYMIGKPAPVAGGGDQPLRGMAATPGRRRWRSATGAATAPPTAVTSQGEQMYRAFETCPRTGRGGGGRSSWESFVMAGNLAPGPARSGGLACLAAGAVPRRAARPQHA